MKTNLVVFSFDNGDAVALIGRWMDWYHFQYGHYLRWCFLILLEMLHRTPHLWDHSNFIRILTHKHNVKQDVLLWWEKTKSFTICLIFFLLSARFFSTVSKKSMMISCSSLTDYARSFSIAFQKNARSQLTG